MLSANCRPTGNARFSFGCSAADEDAPRTISRIWVGLVLLTLPEGSGDPTLLFRAQTEHAICESYPTDTAKDHRGSGDAKRPPKVSMTADRDCRDSEADA